MNSPEFRLGMDRELIWSESEDFFRMLNFRNAERIVCFFMDNKWNPFRQIDIQSGENVGFGYHLLPDGKRNYGVSALFTKSINEEKELQAAIEYSLVRRGSPKLPPISDVKSIRMTNEGLLRIGSSERNENLVLENVLYLYPDGVVERSIVIYDELQ